MAKNKRPPLPDDIYLKVKALKDPIVDLILINGWRRNEVRQAIQNIMPGANYVYIKPKKAKEDIRVELTKKEIELLKVLFLHDISKGASSEVAFNRRINRHFEKLSKKVGYKFTPHNIRATFATNMGELGVASEVIQKAMNHKDYKTTSGYIQPSQKTVKRAKENVAELKTLNGYTIYEYEQLVMKKNDQIARLEQRIRELENE